jgi:hypothetical protein
MRASCLLYEEGFDHNVNGHGVIQVTSAERIVAR